MLLPYTVDVPMARIPIANWAIIGITTVVSLLIIGREIFIEQKSDKDIHDVWRRFDDKELSPEEFEKEMQAAVRDAEHSFMPLALVRADFSPVQLVSHLFVHAGLFHLVGNMIFLFVFGNAVNAKLGHVLFVAFYFLLGSVAGIAWLLTGQGEAAVGASGAIMGLVGIFFVLYPRNDVQIFYMFSFAWTGEFSISSCWLILFYLACDLFGTFFSHDGVAYVAHVVGGLGGMALAFSMVARGWFKPAPGEENLLQILGLKKKKRQRVELAGEAKKRLKKKRGEN